MIATPAHEAIAAIEERRLGERHRCTDCGVGFVDGRDLLAHRAAVHLDPDRVYHDPNRRPAVAPPRKEIRHGTYAGCQAHRKRGEQPCEACRDALRAYNREYFHRRAKTSAPAAVGDLAASGSAAVHSGEGEADGHAADPGPERPPGHDTAPEVRHEVVVMDGDETGPIPLARGVVRIGTRLGDFAVLVDLEISRVPESTEVEILARARLA